MAAKKKTHADVVTFDKALAFFANELGLKNLMNAKPGAAFVIILNEIRRIKKCNQAWDDLVAKVHELFPRRRTTWSTKSMLDLIQMALIAYDQDREQPLHPEHPDLKEYKRKLGLSLGFMSMEKILSTDLIAATEQLHQMKTDLAKSLFSASTPRVIDISSIVQEVRRLVHLEKEIEDEDEENEPRRAIASRPIQSTLEEHHDLISGLLKQQTKISERLNELEGKMVGVLVDIGSLQKITSQPTVPHSSLSFRPNALADKVTDLWKRHYMAWSQDSSTTDDISFDRLVSIATVDAIKLNIKIVGLPPLNIIEHAWTCWQKAQHEYRNIPERFIYAFITGWRP